MIYRLLALNIDGTLLQNNGKIPKGTREAIDFVKRKGVYVTLFTNRNFQSAHKIAKSLKLDSILVTHGGAFISATLDKPFMQKRLSEEKTFNIVQVLEHFECNIRISHERFSIGNRERNTPNLIARTVLSSADPLFYPVQFVDSLGDALRDHPVAAPKIDVIFHSQGEKERAFKTLQKAFADIEYVECDTRRLEILPSHVSKLSGLQVLGEHLGIHVNEMVAIGDSLEDLEVIEHVGLGVAMGNAPLPLKQAADWITRSNNENGVQYMIKEHFRKQFPLPFLKNHTQMPKR
ncbi:Cof-type HAD-IIB family hydrolase [Bacillus cytotoxicus]|uniref:Cof-type HAD-IIB family hydrolase n=1 Tax=Bacillus cytotoxicus TaxID=580165 RepID=UPI0006605199|nr:Cof-type HAD-IIB family hydrolase [Bacillus cytotoxicus]AWC31691.1 HAD family phosphatase [Bacillus cytotoxicus]AWC35729.1 HAD family phosphatase [Bacillus cytotoxicus]AWC59964.1 HAD family phosphatase [Bacillus cytotoxicus]KMT51959.1 haloacid dehalogenase [Bacillus cytotoxicus]MDH2881084.1 Cof-type HAD-IIB family hydrolase [Bacillus cytotoxicus]